MEEGMPPENAINTQEETANQQSRNLAIQKQTPK